MSSSVEGKGITTDTIELQEAVDVVAKLSNNRVLPFYIKEQESDVTKIRIPVVTNNPADKKDVALRRYISDWLKGKIEKITVDTRYEDLPAGTSYYSGEKEYPVIGCLVIQWWPRKHETEFEMWKRMNRKNKE